jgi:hypothetical protein
MVENKHYCLCGCGQQIKWREAFKYSRWTNFISHHASRLRKGKTHIQIYGKTKAKKLIKKQLISRKKTYIKEGWNKEKIIKGYLKLPNMYKQEIAYYNKKTKLIPNATTIRNIFGSLNNLVSESGKNFLPGFHINSRGKTMEQIWGVEKAQAIIEKRKNTFKNHKWTKEEIIKGYLKLPNIYKNDIPKLSKKTKLIPCYRTIKEIFGTIDNLAIESDKNFLPNFKKYKVHIGKYEKQILDYIEKENNIILERNYKIIINKKNYYVDGYDKEHNVVYEVYEKYHKISTQYIYDIKRQNEIINKLNCEFVVLDEEKYLDYLNNRKLIITELVL